MKKLRVGLVVLVGFISIQAMNDTNIVVSDGYGLTASDASNDAIRNAVEKSAGFFLSSQTVIENYTLVKDVIISSANAYCLKTEVISSHFNPDQGVFHSNLRVYIANALFQKELASKIPSDTSIDMSQIDRVKFQMQQAKDRAKSSAIYAASYAQNSFRDVLSFKFDSLQIIDQDIVSGVASINFHYSISWSQGGLLNYVKNINDLLSRVGEFSGRKYQILYDVSFSLRNGTRRLSSSRSSLNSPNLSKLTKQELMERLLNDKKELEALEMLRREQSIRTGLGGKYRTTLSTKDDYQFTVENNAWKRDMAKHDMIEVCTPSDILEEAGNIDRKYAFSNRVYEVLEGLRSFNQKFYKYPKLTDALPFLSFSNLHFYLWEGGSGPSKPLNVICTPSYFSTLMFNQLDSYSNVLTISSPIDKITKDIQNIVITIRMLESGGSSEPRSWFLVIDNKNNNVLEEMADY